MAFLGLLASGYVDENSMHDATDNVGIVSLTPSRYPADLVTKHDAEVNFISADEGARGHLLRGLDEPLAALDAKLHGLSRSLVHNMVQGVTKGYEKTMEVVGVGWTAALAGSGQAAPAAWRRPVLSEAAC